MAIGGLTASEFQEDRAHMTHRKGDEQAMVRTATRTYGMMAGNTPDVLIQRPRTVEWLNTPYEYETVGNFGGGEHAYAAARQWLEDNGFELI